jgi:uncharacterized protein YggE
MMLSFYISIQKRTARYLLVALLTFVANTSFSQNIDTRKKIEVTGNAETEVTPDIIYIGITLKEYFRDNNSKKKIEIEELERQLQTAVERAGIPKENFTINNISSYDWPWEKKKNPDFLATKQYRIKVTDLSKWNQIMSAVDSRGIQNTNIEGYDHSKMETLKRDLKIQALKAAKDKATYLAESVNERLGAALEIQEINDSYYPQEMNVRMNQVMDKAMEEGGETSIDFKKIKLNYQMRAVFELK